MAALKNLDLITVCQNSGRRGESIVGEHHPCRPLNSQHYFKLLALEHTLRLLTKHKAIQFEVDVSGHIELDCFLGASTQLFANLFANAVFHGFEERMAGAIRLHSRMDNGAPGEVRIVFFDDGVGICQENISKIFEPFFYH